MVFLMAPAALGVTYMGCDIPMIPVPLKTALKYPNRKFLWQNASDAYMIYLRVRDSADTYWTTVEVLEFQPYVSVVKQALGDWPWSS